VLFAYLLFENPPQTPAIAGRGKAAAYFKLDKPTLLELKPYDRYVFLTFVFLLLHFT
jgi:hypothetical protein